MSSGRPNGESAGNHRPGPHQWGEGILFRVTNQIYWMLATELCLVAASLPFVGALLFLDRNASNAILYAISGMFLGPAIAATLHCTRKIIREQDLDPARDFIRGYRLNLADTLRYWAPSVAVLTVLLLNLQRPGTRSAWDVTLQIATLAVAVLGSLWLMNMLAISTSFNFRARDLARLSVYYLGRTLRVTLGNLCVLFLVVVLLVLTSDWVLLLCGSLFAYLFSLNTAELVTQAGARFTGSAGDAGSTENPTQ